MSRQTNNKPSTRVVNPFISDTPAGIPSGAVQDPITIFTYDTKLQISRNCLALKLIQQMNALSKIEPVSDDNAVSYIVTVSNLLVPGIHACLSANKLIQLETVAVKKETLDPDSFCSEIWEGEKEDDPYHPDRRNVKPQSTGFMGNITPDVDMPCVTPEVAGGRWGVEMFPIGKNVTEQNRSAFQISRPNAIFNKYRLVDAHKLYFQREDYAPNVTVLQTIGRTFTIHQSLRETLAREWIHWTTGTCGREASAFSVTFKLLDGAGFGGPMAILNLLEAYPILAEFPPLRPQVKEFHRALEVYGELAPAERGYQKVIRGDQYSVFRNCSRGPLLAVAIMYGTTLAPTLGNFLNTDAYIPLGHDVNRYLQSRGLPVIPNIGGVTGQPQDHAEGAQ